MAQKKTGVGVGKDKSIIEHTLDLFPSSVKVFVIYSLLYYYFMIIIFSVSSHTTLGRFFLSIYDITSGTHINIARYMYKCLLQVQF